MPVDAARARAGEPGRFYGTGMLARLPAVDVHDRALTGIALQLSSTVTAAEEDADLPEMAREMAARAGLTLRLQPDGSTEVVEDGSTEGRRCRLWGDLWADHRIPDIPDEAWFTDLLTTLGVPAVVVGEIGAAVREYGQLRQAAERCTAITSVDGWGATAEETAEHDSLCDYLEIASDVLTRYAQTLSRALPALRDHHDRTADAGRSCQHGDRPGERRAEDDPDAGASGD